MTQPTSTATRLLTPRFLVVVSSGFCYFLALAMLTPVLPHYVEDSLDAGSVAVGVAVGAFAVGAIALRTYAGRVGDRIGRRVLIIGGALIVAASTSVYGVVHALWWLIFMRVVTADCIALGISASWKRMPSTRVRMRINRSSGSK